MAKGQNRILRNIVLAVLAVIIVLAALGAWKWYGEKQGDEKREAAQSAFKKWDSYFATVDKSWSEINKLVSGYSDLDTRLSDAFFTGNLSEMGRLAGESKANLDQQKKILADVDSQLQDRQSLIADLKNTVENLPDTSTTNKSRLNDAISEVEESTWLMNEVTSGYSKQLGYEYQMCSLFAQRSQSLIDDGIVTIGLSEARASTNALTGPVQEKFNRAQDLGKKTASAWFNI